MTELPAGLQSKLLRAIETRSFYRVGGVRKVQVSVRIVAATNRSIDQFVAEGKFRSDLLYRINGFQITLPSLRERTEDIEPIAQHLLKQLGGAHPPELTPEALTALCAYHWPGNVRQLRNCLERALILANNGRITTSELPPEVARPANGAATVVNFQPPSPQAAANGASDFTSAPTSLRDVERQQIIGALEQTNWHRGRTAEILGISPSTLYRRLRDYNLDSHH